MFRKKTEEHRKRSRSGGTVTWGWLQDEETAKIKAVLDSDNYSIPDARKQEKSGFDPYDKKR